MSKTIPKEYKEYTIGLALFDIVPVLLFLLSGTVIWAMYGSKLFAAGVLACFIGGMCKVIWKLRVVLRGRDARVLTSTFRFFMILGFAMMLLSLFVSAASGAGGAAAGTEVIEGNPGTGTVFQGLWRGFTHMPATLFFIAGIAGMCAMGYLGTHMDKSARSNWIEEGVNAASQLAILIGAVIVYLGVFYHGGEAAKAALASTDTVAVTESEQGYMFDGPGTTDILVFYQGAKVEPAAYAPLMSSLASQGIDCYLCKMPYNLSLFDEDMAGDIRAQLSGAPAGNAAAGTETAEAAGTENAEAGGTEGAQAAGGDAAAPAYQNWYIAGHSLGGTSAANYLAGLQEETAAEDGAEGEEAAPAEGEEAASENAEAESAPAWNGIIFLSAYPMKKVSVPGLLVWGSNDNIVKRSDFERVTAEGLWPDDFTRYTIYGGNHAGFGSYGAQKGDGRAEISAEEQQRQTAEAILEWIRNREGQEDGGDEE